MPGIINPMHIAQKFEGLLEKYRHPDGRRWSGQEIDEATGGDTLLRDQSSEGQNRKPWLREDVILANPFGPPAISG